MNHSVPYKGDLVRFQIQCIRLTSSQDRMTIEAFYYISRDLTFGVLS